jgi:hypothetical protein
VAAKVRIRSGPPRRSDTAIDKVDLLVARLRTVRQDWWASIGLSALRGSGRANATITVPSSPESAGSLVDIVLKAWQLNHVMGMMDDYVSEDSWRTFCDRFFDAICAPNFDEVNATYIRFVEARKQMHPSWSFGPEILRAAFGAEDRKRFSSCEMLLAPLGSILAGQSRCIVAKVFGDHEKAKKIEDGMQKLPGALEQMATTFEVTTRERGTPSDRSPAGEPDEALRAPVAEFSKLRREHHYLFAHDLLPRIFFQHPARFFAVFMYGDAAEENLKMLWDDVGGQVEATGVGKRLRFDGVRTELDWIGAFPVLLIDLPVPQFLPECHMVALVLNGDFASGPQGRARTLLGFPAMKSGLATEHPDCTRLPTNVPRGYFFTLEKGFTETGQSRTVLGGWTQGHDHLNYSTGPSPTHGLFLSAIEAILVHGG